MFLVIPISLSPMSCPMKKIINVFCVLREAKQSEDTLVRESSTHTFKLKDATSLLEKSCEDLTQLNKSWEQTCAQRELLLKNKEAEIKSNTKQTLVFEFDIQKVSCKSNTWQFPLFYKKFSKRMM